MITYALNMETRAQLLKESLAPLESFMSRSDQADKEEFGIHKTQRRVILENK